LFCCCFHIWKGRPSYRSQNQIQLNLTLTKWKQFLEWHIWKEAAKIQWQITSHAFSPSTWNYQCQQFSN
jgi:hypothetical protein